MTPKQRALKALEAAFPGGRVDAYDVEVMKPFQSGWQNAAENAPKQSYLFAVTDADGVNYTAGCFFEDEFMGLFDDEELAKAFKERFVPRIL